MAKDTWYKMDNVAKVFLASANERDTRSFRMTCTLNEDIDEAALQEAVTKAAKERPQYQVTILRGLFWHYMEQTDDMPVVTKEKDRPCMMLIGNDTFGKLHYRVTYYNNRINLDFFHAIADGNGAIEYLNLIVSHYLKLKHSDLKEAVNMTSGASESALSQDAFKQYFDNKKKYKSVKKNRKAYHIKGLKHPFNQVQFLEVHMPVKDVLAQAKSKNVTLTSYIGSLLMMSIYKDMPVLKRKKPVTISMPVNLRNYYPSNTSRNFFNSVNVSHVFKGDETIDSLCEKYNASLKEELTTEAIAARMYNYEKLENLLFIRMVPLFIKNPVVNQGARKQKKTVSAVVSNLGKMNVNEDMAKYINSYCAFCSTDSLFVVLNTYKDDFVMGISSAYRNTEVLCDFIKSFSDNGIDVTVYSNELIEI
ncbi:MAG: hypothetical protein J6U09_01425 [Lachnospiraceae bacterium]|nr:hypothetical protein [Lachnospiraceae bacterium]